jgi:transcriptional regulator with XRE-family HTH domain
MLDRRSSVWERYGSEEEFEADLREIMPFADAAGAILALRDEFDLTQRQLAERIGTTQSVIARLESGERDFKIGVLNRISDALDLRWKLVFEPRVATLEFVANPAIIDMRPYLISHVDRPSEAASPTAAANPTRAASAQNRSSEPTVALAS